MRPISNRSYKLDLRVPTDLAAMIREVHAGEVSRGVEVAEATVVVRLIRLGIATARELGRLPNDVAYKG